MSAPALIQPPAAPVVPEFKVILAPAVILERCHYCSKWVSHHDILIIGLEEGGARMCQKCYFWHRAALDLLVTGREPLGCQECGVTMAELRSRTTGDIKLDVVPKDGIYQVLCKQCSNAYVPKRVDLYGDTAFGRIRKLK